MSHFFISLEKQKFKIITMGVGTLVIATFLLCLVFGIIAKFMEG
jgi:hypothetical protein